MARTLDIHQKLVKGCGICQQFKIDRSSSHPSFKPVKGAISTRPFAHCSMDLITDLPPVDGSDALLVVVDQGLLKGVILCPTNKQSTWTESENSYMKIFTNNSVYQTRCFPIEDHNLQQKCSEPC